MNPGGRDLLRHDRHPLVVRVEHPHQGDRAARRRRRKLVPRPSLAALDARFGAAKAARVRRRSRSAPRQRAGRAAPAAARARPRCGRIPMAHLLRGVAAGGTLRVIAADTTDLVAEALARHETRRHRRRGPRPDADGVPVARPRAAQGPPRPRDRQARRRRPARRRHRRCRPRRDGARLRPMPRDRAAARADGKLDVGGAVGRDGEIEVIRSHAPYGDPYTSSVELASGEIAEDVATFLARSEQIASAVLLGRELRRRDGVARPRRRGVGARPPSRRRDPAGAPGGRGGRADAARGERRAFGQLTDALARGPAAA